MKTMLCVLALLVVGRAQELTGLSDWRWALERDPGFTSRLVAFDMREPKGGDPECYGCLAYMVEIDTGMAGQYVTITENPQDIEDGYCVPDGPEHSCIELWGCKVHNTTFVVQSTFPAALTAWTINGTTTVPAGSEDQPSIVTIQHPEQTMGCAEPYRTVLIVFAGTAIVSELRMLCSPCGNIR
jgi:hypothetical protein